MPRMRMNQAIVAALVDEMRADPSVIVFGEDVAQAGGPFKTSDGLLDEFGATRVRDTPISEMAFLGAAVGAAATGLRPVAEIMFIEFLGVALDMVVTEAAKFRYLSGGQVSCPMTVRASVGAGLGFGTQHSQTLETWLYATPGITVAVASTPQTAYGLLRSAIRSDDPVVVLEPRALYAYRGDLEIGDEGIIPLGTAEVVESGSDVTIVTTGQMRNVALEAAASADWSAEVLDLRTLIPWDRRTVLESVARTKRLVTIEENPFSGGWGTEVSSVVAADLFGELHSPVLRVTCPDVPVPFGKELEQKYLPGPEYVVDQIGQLLSTGRLPKPWWEREEVTA